MRNLILLGLVALFLTGCGLFSDSFEQTFDDAGAWRIGNYDGVSSEITDGRLELTILFPDSMFVTTAGRRSLADGVYEVDVEAISGSAESAYGLVFRATPGATDYYYFLISADGFYSIGGCQNACEDDQFIRVADAMWIESLAIEPGLNEKHTLKVETNGDELVYFVNDEEIGRFEDATLSEGDVGLMLQTFDSAATIAFDNLRFTPANQ